MSVTFLESDDMKKLDGIRHGFFTRKGGVSDGIYASLNCGYGSDDMRDNVTENRNRAMHAFCGNDASVLSTLYQIHSDITVKMDQGCGFDNRIEGDAMVSTTPGVVLGILTADCGPVVFADATAKVIGAAHAGWKGAAYGVLENTIKKMCELGAAREHIHATLGPCIHQPSYEVGPEFRETLLELSNKNAAFFNMSPQRSTHFQFDLPAFIKAQLARAGLRHIHHVAKDTCVDEGNFFSYRRTTLAGEKEYGRGLSVVMLEK